MPVIDKATGRVVAVLVLLVVIGACLRGYLPGVARAARQEPPRSSASLVYVVALLSISLVIVGIAVIARLRDPRRAPAAAGLPERRFGGGVGRPGWRVLLVAAGVLVAWLLLVWLLAHFIVPHEIGQPPGGTAPTTPPPGTGTSPPPEPRDSGGNRDVLGYLIAISVGLLVLIVVGIVTAMRRRRNAIPRITAAEPSTPSRPAGTSETLARAAEVGLAEIGDLSREPRAAIIACYAAMERELAHIPEAAPQDFDTPTEVLARAVEHRALHADNAARLVKLFTEARFSSHVMTEEHREIAVGVLQLVLAELRSVV
ncbi:DUF4129 domain-containing protein [Mycobacterium sp.]|uniref:DUF4129 domain-containing protein n=1 Tax=Mycobacterium sp. TaxID=1785 RepID=UPI003D6C3682